MPSCAEACASCIEQIAHHADGKTALREASAIERKPPPPSTHTYTQGPDMRTLVHQRTMFKAASVVSASGRSSDVT